MTGITKARLVAVVATLGVLAALVGAGKIGH